MVRIDRSVLTAGVSHASTFLQASKCASRAYLLSTNFTYAKNQRPWESRPLLVPVRMASTDEAVKTAQARAKDAAGGDANKHHAVGDVAHTTQQVSSEHAAKHGDASGMTSASDRQHDSSNSDDAKVHRDDQVSGNSSSSS